MDAVEDIKQRLAIEDVIGEYVQLKRAGRNFKGLSPFGAEKSPSFVVSPEKQIWHDFSSGRGGDMFSFVMEMEGLDFKQTLDLLARKAGIDLAQYRSGESNGVQAQKKERAHAALELAAKFYQVQFSQSKIALEYVFTKRQFTKQTALDWQLGYSPNNGTALVDFLRSKKFSELEIKEAGLSSDRYNGLADMFRGRLMIPLCDGSGRVIGFTARLLEDNPNAPKYINTPQTVVYDKSRHVFGLHHAKAAIRTNKYAVIAEGNLDVIMSHQAGVKQVVATAGTALTEFQLKALKRLTGDIRLCFDADKAGMNATERAIPIASKVEVDLSVISIPSGKDPDELIKQSAETWQEIIQKPQYALDWLIDRYARQLDMGSAQGKRAFSSTILQVVRELSNKVEKEHYLEVVAERLGVSKSAITDSIEHEQTAKRLKPNKVDSAKPSGVQKQSIDFTKTQSKLLTLILHQPKLRQETLAALSENMFTSSEGKHLFNFLEANPDFSGKPQEAELLKEIGEYVKILTLQYESLYGDLELNELRYEAARLQVHLIEQYVKFQKQRISSELQAADSEQQQLLLQEARQLDSMLRGNKKE